MIALVNAYAKLFPDEARRIYTIFIETTWGATASREVAGALARASALGHRGDIAGFRKNRPFPRLDSLINRVTAGTRALDADLGPELWIANTGFKIGRGFWDVQRTEPLTMNLNATNVVELMTIPGVSLAGAHAILAARERCGSFGSVGDLRGSVPQATIARLREMQQAMARLGTYTRD